MKRPSFRAVGLALLIGAGAMIGALALLRPGRGIHFDPEKLDAARWVQFYRPQQASNGYNLVLYKRRVPMLIDMNGAIVHSWPKARVRGRARLTPEGNLLAIGTDRVIRELDWQGRLLWEFEHAVADNFPHHDLRRLRNGNTLLVYRDLAQGTDYLLEVDSGGEIVWDWQSSEHLTAWLSEKNPHDRTHINSVQELPPNRWFDDGDSRFAPGNILLSARQLDRVFVIDKTTGEVVWSYSEGLDYQHEAAMTESGTPGAGNILIFNNGYHNRFSNRRSSVIEIDPTTHEIVWKYTADTFFSRTGGVEQSLPNGNVLITSSRGGRVFEVDRSGAIVWQWTPPYLPMRPRRYPDDYSPRFADLSPATGKSVGPPVIRPFVDLDLYRFGLEGDVLNRTIAGESRPILNRTKQCHRLFLPAGPTLEVGYGLDRKWIAAAGLEDYRASFIVSIRADGREDRQILMQQTAELIDDPWHEQAISLSDYAWTSVELCLGTDNSPLTVGGKHRIPVLWGDPVVTTSSEAQRGSDDELGQGDRQDAEQQLKALGYVD